MEDSLQPRKEQEIVFSRSIKAGKRIYYLDVKRSRNDDMFIAITESKKRVSGPDESAQVTFEKHKIFLYKEDFEKFSQALEDVISFISQATEEPELDTPINDSTPSKSIVDFDIDFEL